MEHAHFRRPAEIRQICVRSADHYRTPPVCARPHDSAADGVKFRLFGRASQSEGTGASTLEERERKQAASSNIAAVGATLVAPPFIASDNKATTRGPPTPPFLRPESIPPR